MLSNPVNAVFADDAATIEAQVTIQYDEQPDERCPRRPWRRCPTPRAT